MSEKARNGQVELMRNGYCFVQWWVLNRCDSVEGSLSSLLFANAKFFPKTNATLPSLTFPFKGYVGRSGEGRFESLSGTVCFQIAFHSVPNSRSSVFELDESTRGFCSLSVMFEAK
ncbi:hypothetical protein CEXT_624441 [Caerostris extrusa]|uniref:Uncharacterized protein n=1 Tax=Caerostris extrusa TaxID=172846 RepID=A0AAV4NPT1_CAEEX|nr:hypothetical protein CEXT_624441 [Caerostris extrusa]